MGEVQIPRVVLEAMQEQLALLQKAVNKQGKQLQQQAEQIRQKDERIGELEQMLLNMQRARFGQQSEKRKYVLNDGTEQLSMFGEAAANNEAQEKSGADSPGDNGEITVCAHTRKPRRTLEELCRNLPVEERVIDLPEEEKVKEPPHNTAAHLAVPLPPSASCKQLDLPPASLRNLQARLTANSLAS